MNITSDNLLNDLTQRTLVNAKEAEKFCLLSLEKLNYRSNSKSWSILECLEHLNLYGDFYIPEIKKRIESSKTSSQMNFKSGFLGDYFAKMMLPRLKVNKMKTFKVMNPIGSKLDETTISRFISQQEELLQLLEKARTIDLSKTKTAISISKAIKLKLGDTFRVVIYHNERHIFQANKVLEIK